MKLNMIIGRIAVWKRVHTYPTTTPRLRLVLGLAVLLLGARVALAEDTPRVKDDEMRRHAMLVRVETVSEGRRQNAERVPDPLMHYNDPARGAAKGSLWAWGTTGRPSAILEMEVNPSRPSTVQWVHGVVSLSSGLIAASWDDGKAWEATQPGLIPCVLPDALAPAGSKPDRLRQMKDLARRFGVREDAGPVKGKIRLRLLPTPIHRYQDPSSGLQDGAIFVFAFGTNPEALLVLESRTVGSSAHSYHYGFARVSGGALMADLDGHEVWTQTEANPPYTGAAYINRRHPALKGSE